VWSDTLPVGRWKPARRAIAPHGSLLMCFQPDVASGTRRAQKDEAGLAILRVVRRRCRLVDIALNEPRGTRQASALMTDGRQFDTRPSGGIPNELIFGALDQEMRSRCLERHAERLGGSQRHVRLWVVEAAILAVRRVPRLAPAEVS
jgi:hypothetical protein